jgi:Cu-Zn family superoxide dismutase
VQGSVEMWEDTIKIYVVAVILVAAASAAHAASETITMNSIDANGVDKTIGTLRLSDTKAGLRITPLLTDLPPGDWPTLKAIRL